MWKKRKRQEPRKPPSEAYRYAGAALKEVLPAYLVRAALEVLPPQVSTETVDLLLRCIQLWVVPANAEERHAAQRRRAGAGRRSDLEANLREAWSREGGDAADVAKIRAMVLYRLMRRRYYFRLLPVLVPKYVEKAPDRMRSFWVTSGHDLSELDIFMSDVDAEFVIELPG
jgi:hypothetical protein